MGHKRLSQGVFFGIVEGVAVRGHERHRLRFNPRFRPGRKPRRTSLPRGLPRLLLSLRLLSLARKNCYGSRAVHQHGGPCDRLGLTWKVSNFVIESHPGMPRGLPHGYRGPGHRRIGECAKGDADKVRECFRIPEHGAAAVGAEMLFYLSPRIGDAHVNLAWTFGAYLIFREKGADAKS
jgi:hypothetical protein